MAPKVNITLTIEAPLVDDLDDLSELRGSSRSAEICAASAWWINQAIENGELDRDSVWDPKSIHEQGVSQVGSR